MNFIDAISIIIPCPFFLTMADVGMVQLMSLHMTVSVAFIAVTDATLASMHFMGLLHFLLCYVAQNFQTDLTALATYCPEYRRSVVLPGAKPFFSWHVAGVDLHVAGEGYLFHLHSGTYRRFQ